MIFSSTDLKNGRQEAAAAGRVHIPEIPDMDIRQRVQVIAHRGTPATPQPTGFAALMETQL